MPSAADSGRRHAPRRGSARSRRPGPCGEAAGKVGRQERVEIGVAGGPGVERFEPLRGTQEQPGRIVAPPLREGDRGAERDHAWTRCASSSGPASAATSNSTAAVCAPARCFNWAAANARRARDCGSTLNAAARSRNAAAAAKPPRRLGSARGPLQLGRNLVVREWSSPAPGATHADQDRDPHRSRPPARGEPAGALPTRRGVIRRRPHERMPEPHARADLEQAVGLGRGGRLRRDAEQPRRLENHRRDRRPARPRRQPSD